MQTNQIQTHMKIVPNLTTNLRPWSAVLAAALALATQLHAQPTGQWDFNSGDLTATVGSDLQYADGPGGPTQLGTTFGTTTTLGIPDINGTAAHVMRFSANVSGMGYLMPDPPTANGGGSLVNDYTLIMDVLYPASANAQERPFLDADGSLFVAGPDLVVDASNGIGTTPSGPYFGAFTTNTWYRIGFVIQQDLATVTCYSNGVRIGSDTITPSGAAAGLDGRFGLTPGSTSLILGSTDTNSTAGYVSSIQIRDVALNAGQMAALGGPSATGIPQVIPPVPSYIDSRTPDVNSTTEPPLPAIHVALMAGDTTIAGNSISLYFDGALVPATVTNSPPNYTIDYPITTILRPLSSHQVSLVYSDSVAGLQTNSWNFSVMNYQNVTLPAPFYLENFDEVAPGSLPAGWVVTNDTEVDVAGYNIMDPTSDAYKDWIVIDPDIVTSITSWDSARRLTLPPIVVNGQLLDSLIHTNFAYAESDQRSGSQVQAMFTPEIDCTGKTNVYASWHNIYEQNQDNLGAVEYSVDNGNTWHPVVYFLPDSDGQDFTSGVVVSNADGTINAVATFASTAHGPAYGLPYGTFILAPITTNLDGYIVPEPDDEANITIESGVAHNAWIGKDIEIHRLPLADNSAHVILRFLQTGTGSWYFGIDDLGLYSINTPVVTTQPASQTVDAGTPATFSVVANGPGTLLYQWEFNGQAIAGATNSSFTINNVTPANAGLYDVVVSNSDGPTTSGTAQLTVVTTPQMITQPLSQVTYVNATVTFSPQARGGRPLAYQWYLNGSAVSGANGTPLTINNAATANTGDYQLVVTNSYGAVTSAVAHLTVYSGPITDSLVAHLKFDNDYTDSSGNGTDGSAVGTPAFATGIIGQAVHVSSSGTPANAPATNNYVTLGTPPQLSFGSSDFSISFWTKVSFQNDDKPFLSNKDWGSGSNPGWALASEGTGMKWNFRDNLSSRRDSGTVAPQIEDGNWHNVVVTFIRSSVGSIYVDGVVVNVANVAPDAGNAIGSADTGLPINIGQDGTGHYTDGGGAAALDALIDDVGIWRRALAPSEVASIHAQGVLGHDLTTATGFINGNLGRITIGHAAGNITFSWTSGATVRLQKATNLSAPTWTDVSGTLGVGTYSEPATNSAAFYRLFQP